MLLKETARRKRSRKQLINYNLKTASVEYGVVFFVKKVDNKNIDMK